MSCLSYNIKFSARRKLNLINLWEAKPQQPTIVTCRHSQICKFISLLHNKQKNCPCVEQQLSKYAPAVKHELKQVKATDCLQRTLVCEETDSSSPWILTFNAFLTLDMDNRRHCQPLLSFMALHRSPSLGAWHYPIFLSRRFHKAIYFQFELISNSDPHRNLTDQLQSQARTNVVMSAGCQHVHVRPHCFILTKCAHVDWNWPFSREKHLKIGWSAKMPLHCLIMGVAGSQ